MISFSLNKVIIVICFTVAIYAIFLIALDVTIISEEIKKFEFKFLPLILIFVISGWFCLFTRWHLLLKHQNIIIPKKKFSQNIQNIY